MKGIVVSKLVYNTSKLDSVLHYVVKSEARCHNFGAC